MYKTISLLGLAALLAMPAPAQIRTAPATPPTLDRETEETIVIKQDADRPQTTIEIADGQVSVNGEVVARMDEADGRSIRRKIIVDGGADAPPSMGESDRPSVIRKTVLGVLTETPMGTSGAHIKQVLPGSAAQEAGLKPGDRITRVDDRTISTSEALVEIIAGHDPGDKVTITYTRDGKTRSAKATLKAADPRTTIPSNPFGNMPNGSFERNAPYLQDMQERIEEMLGGGRNSGVRTPKLGFTAEDTEEENGGVKVLALTPGGAADKAGLRTGDRITHVQGEPLESVADLGARMQLYKPGEKVELRYVRAGETAKTELLIPKIIRQREF